MTESRWISQVIMDDLGMIDEGYIDYQKYTGPRLFHFYLLIRILPLTYHIIIKILRETV